MWKDHWRRHRHPHCCAGMHMHTGPLTAMEPHWCHWRTGDASKRAQTPKLASLPSMVVGVSLTHPFLLFLSRSKKRLTVKKAPADKKKGFGLAPAAC